ncbi:SUF system NifU family Fe-S cluster assembly protein [Candidatus Synechococcus calcipolaris G9]|uniref:SUF system NifU family Fe-S cluster assembly protein n=1 Tax=Candidatus Synechococcus calcipolaris G9 TaxID=1497997 RepID=A0ABT6F0J1_9SYNE|nr:SUF system NifU family Fe-S cluster assembly protein [Candidatus Synechococcus calcipolaris]MDG2991340.1 SUF system NifU family Fe-S cluster assembly protein [Candidatus Synechococcus calcipolaris G9]
MTLDNLRNLYQQVILEHYKKPRHRGQADPVDRQQRGHNPSCGDTIDLTLSLEVSADTSEPRIKQIKFEGEGCAIAMASADLMADALQGQTITTALKMVEQFQTMMKGQFEFPREFRKLNAMQGVAQFPVRIKCATLTWHTLRAALEQTEPSPTNEASGFVTNEDEY